MDESIPPRVITTNTTKEASDMLETSYQVLGKVNTSKLKILRNDFESLSMKDIELVESFYIRFIVLINQLKYHGENMKDRRTIEKVLRSLPQKFESLVVTFEENKDLLQFTIDKFQASIINHKHRISR